MNTAARIANLEAENERLTLALREAERLIEELEALEDVEDLLSALEERNTRMSQALAEHEALREKIEAASDPEAK